MCTACSSSGTLLTLSRSAVFSIPPTPIPMSISPSSNLMSNVARCVLLYFPRTTTKTLSVHVSICLSVFLPLSLSMSLCVSQSLCVFLFMSLYVSACLSTYKLSFLHVEEVCFADFCCVLRVNSIVVLIIYRNSWNRRVRKWGTK
jgi:hypothetical protein